MPRATRSSRVLISRSDDPNYPIPSEYIVINKVLAKLLGPTPYTEVEVIDITRESALHSFDISLGDPRASLGAPLGTSRNLPST